MMLLEVEDLHVEYRVLGGIAHALNGISLDLASGEALGLVGESGCGKTTLGSSILRLLPPTGQISKGRVLFGGKDLTQLSEEEMRKTRWRKISMVFQGAMNSFDPTMTIENQIAEAILVHEPQVGKKKALEIARQSLASCEVEPSKGRAYPHELSGGMKQRACIAMALVLQPQLVIADEITTALDVMTQAQIFRLLRSIRRTHQLSLLIISHDLSVLAKNCDRLAVIYAGYLVERGTTSQILNNSCHPYLKGLLACIPKIKGERGVIPAIQGSPPSLFALPSGCAFAPRCSEARPECFSSVPQLHSVETGHLVACHCFRDQRGYPNV